MGPETPLGVHTRQLFDFARKQVFGNQPWGNSAAVAGDSDVERLSWPQVS